MVAKCDWRNYGELQRPAATLRKMPVNVSLTLAIPVDALSAGNCDHVQFNTGGSDPIDQTLRIKVLAVMRRRRIVKGQPEAFHGKAGESMVQDSSASAAAV